MKHIFEKQNFNYCFLHGPLQTPVMPFSGPEFPQFKKCGSKYSTFLNLNKKKKLNERHFINVYLESLKYLLKSKFQFME